MMKKMINTMAFDGTSPEALLARPYARRLVPAEEGGFTASIQEFPGCFAEGDSADEALNNLEEAALSWIEAQLELGQPIPSPIDFFGYSGKIALRIPRGIHKQVAEMAVSEGASINQLLVAAISNYVGAVGVLGAVMKQFRANFHTTTHNSININLLGNVRYAQTSANISDLSSKQVHYFPVPNLVHEITTGKQNG